MTPDSVVRVAMGQSPRARNFASSFFLLSCLVAPVVFLAFFKRTSDTELKFSLFLASVFTFVWLLLAHDIKNFAHGRRVFLNPIHIEAKPEHTQARCISLLADLGFMLYLAYLASRLLVASA